MSFCENRNEFNVQSTLEVKRDVEKKNEIMLAECRVGEAIKGEKKTLKRALNRSNSWLGNKHYKVGRTIVEIESLLHESYVEKMSFSQRSALFY